MSLALSRKQLEEVHDIESSLNCCKSREVADWIDDIHFEEKKSHPPGIPILCSCGKMFCPFCMRRVVFKERWSMFERFEDLGNVYHFTFSPEYEFFFYSDYPAKKVASIVKNRLMESLKKFVFDRGGQISGFLGWHYIADSKDKLKTGFLKKKKLRTRLHAHILFTTDIKIDVCSVEDKKKHLKETGMELYSDDELLIMEDFKARLKRTKFYDFQARIDDRISKKKKTLEFIYWYNVDYKEEKNEDGRIGSRAGLYKAVGYLCKYMLFSDDKSVLDDHRREFLEYYVVLKQNFISPFGLIRKGSKKLRKRDDPPTFVNGVTGFDMVCVSRWVLNVEMGIYIVPVWDYDFGYKLSKVELEWLDKVKKRAGYDE